MTRSLFERPTFILILIVVQTLCAGFFLWDVAHDGLAATNTVWDDVHLMVEAVAVVVLIVGIVFEARVLLRLIRRKAHLERKIGLAARAFHDVVEERFLDWGLTTAERDVAHFTVKGLPISEIARMRGSAEGTVKSQLNAIYRKAGVGGRGELLSLLIEDLTDSMDPPGATGAADGNRADLSG